VKYYQTTSQTLLNEPPVKCSLHILLIWNLDQGCTTLFAIAGCIKLIFMKYGRHEVQDIFCIASVLLPTIEPTLLSHVCLAVFLLNILI